MIIKDWKMDFENYKELSCTAPCDMYSVLYDYGYISDPYYATNEKELSQLSRYDTVFYADFDLSDEELKKEKIEITFLGIDTIADIYVNDVLLGSVKNMHRKYEYDIKSIAKEKNKVKLHIYAPIPYFEKMEKEHHLYTNWDTVVGAAHLRKALYMSGWDWAPTLPNMGIFRPVLVNSYDGDKIEDVLITQHHENGEVTLDFSIDTKHKLSGLTYKVVIDGKEEFLKDGKGSVKIENPRLWWPVGYGEQSLYTTEFVIYNGDKKLDTVTKEIGLRTLTLSREEDETGSEFCFVINGVKIFAKGANYVPVDNLISRITNERIEGIIKDCLFANFNCVRVWGGAYYPEDYFYELCDKYGLIVWQDFMMACSNVWMNKENEDEFIKEATYNVKRIRHHACLGLLCGNNEMEEAICNWPCADGNDPEVRRDYLKLYEDIFPRICKEHAPQTAYTPSSPTSGGNFDDPTNNTRGDVHFWLVWNGDCEFDEYRKHKFRFCSEYGFESLPSMKTINSFCPDDEKNLLSYTMEGHQKHCNGNVKLIKYLAEQYRMPKNLETTVYATQLNQANAIKFGVEHFRRHRGYTMGSIYWQLNDPWPVASWSSIDYFGRYKALHYFAKRFYADVAIGLFEENGKITVNVANEKMSEFEGTVKIGIMKNDGELIYELEKEISVSALSSSDVISMPSADFKGQNDRFFYAELYDKNAELISRNLEIGTKPKHFKFIKPKIKVKCEEAEGGYTLEFSSCALARSVFVSFKNHDVSLSDNFFDLYNAGTYKIFAKTNLKKSKLLRELSLMSVFDIDN